MADLGISEVVLDELRGTLLEVADLIRLGTTARRPEHSASHSAVVAAAGDETVTIQVARSDAAAESAALLAAKANLIATTMVELDGRLADRSTAPAGASRGGSF